MVEWRFEQTETFTKNFRKVVPKNLQNSFNIQLWKSVNNAKKMLLTNPQRGIRIPRRNISKGVYGRYKNYNLWKINLVNYWRLIYAI